MNGLAHIVRFSWMSDAHHIESILAPKFALNMSSYIVSDLVFGNESVAQDSILAPKSALNVSSYIAFDFVLC